LLKSLDKYNGLFLVVGPTGSGKTTTLYALLQQISSIEKNIVTIEDPVEYRLAGINQVQINPQAELTFAAGLRAVLRQDPDIILVGEIRDLETAEIALRAALTGHLVLGTLHTRDTIEAVIRLQDMGIPSFRIGAALRGVLAQRLVPVYCSTCLGRGCPACKDKGYSGRRALFEYLPVTAKIQETINKTVGYNQLREAAFLQGLVPFNAGAKALCSQGATSAQALKEFLD
jgi:type II secretory ATPase GspE/PulE/Tfp pilus assembly ATPase PilB-like protein